MLLVESKLFDPSLSADFYDIKVGYDILRMLLL